MAVKTFTKYLGDDGTIYGIVVDPGSVASIGTPPTGEISSPIRAKISKGNREAGIRPRRLGLSRVVGSGATAYREYRDLPQLTPTAFSAAEIGSTVTINTVAWTIISKTQEDY